MEVSATYSGGAKFEVEARGHRLICDQPLDNGGEDQGISPPEFLLASLATCAGYYASQYLHARNLPVEDLRVRLTRPRKHSPPGWAISRSKSWSRARTIVTWRASCAP